jgi:hypothetical protein
MAREVGHDAATARGLVRVYNCRDPESIKRKYVNQTLGYHPGKCGVPSLSRPAA